MPTTHSCPNCGHSLSPGLTRSKVAGCEACGSTVILADRQFLSPGEAGEMHEGPTLLRLGQTVHIGRDSYTPLGVVRYDYGRGWWDEFWCRDETSGDGVWISVDEGDLVLEREEPRRLWPATVGSPSLGATVTFNGRVFTAREKETATCIAFRGELPEAPVLGETHVFVNLTDLEGAALSLEIWDGGRAWFSGQWLDPYEIEIGGLAGS